MGEGSRSPASCHVELGNTTMFWLKASMTQSTPGCEAGACRRAGIRRYRRIGTRPSSTTPCARRSEVTRADGRPLFRRPPRSGPRGMPRARRVKVAGLCRREGDFDLQQRFAVRGRGRLEPVRLQARDHESDRSRTFPPDAFTSGSGASGRGGSTGLMNRPVRFVFGALLDPAHEHGFLARR